MTLRNGLLVLFAGLSCCVPRAMAIPLYVMEMTPAQVISFGDSESINVAEVRQPGAFLSFQIEAIPSLGKIYWTSPGTIGSMDLAGNNATPFVSLTDPPIGTVAIRDLAADEANQLLYVTGANTGAVYVLGYDGQLKSRFYLGAHAIAVAATDDAFFASVDTNNYVGSIMRYNRDGTNPQTLFTGSIWDLAIDPVSEKLYWSTKDAILRSNLDGSGIETFLDGLTFLRGIGIDQENGYIYWTQGFSSGVHRASLATRQSENVFEGKTWNGAIDVVPVSGTLTATVSASGASDFEPLSAVSWQEFLQKSSDEAFPFNGTVLGGDATTVTWDHYIVTGQETKRAVIEVGLVGFGATRERLSSFLLDGFNLTNLLQAAIDSDPLGDLQHKTYRIEIPMEAFTAMEDGSVHVELGVKNLSGQAGDPGPGAQPQGIGLDFANVRTFQSVPEPTQIGLCLIPFLMMRRRPVR